jgi:hypothetical protein
VPVSPNASTQTTESSSSMGRDRLVRITAPNATNHPVPSRFDHVTQDGDGRTSIATASSTASTAPPMKRQIERINEEERNPPATDSRN